MDRFLQLSLSSDDEDDEEVFLVMATDLLAYNSARNSRYLTREAIMAPNNSPWTHLLLYSNEDSFLSVTVVRSIIKSIKGRII
jgi:hypothetical protein